MLGDLSDSETQGGRSLKVDAPPERRISRLRVLIEAERPGWFYWVPVLVGVGALFYFVVPFELSVLAVAGVVMAAIASRPVGGRMTYSSALTGVLVCCALGVGRGQASNGVGACANPNHKDSSRSGIRFR